MSQLPEPITAENQPLCICGHAEESHTYDERNEFGCEECGYATCGEYRACLSWPDAAGLWWCDKFTVHVCPVRRIGSYHVIGTEGDDRWFNRREFESLLGPARFVKLLESNPFESK